MKKPIPRGIGFECRGHQLQLGILLLKIIDPETIV
jgi:hypothetical protein